MKNAIHVDPFDIKRGLFIELFCRCYKRSKLSLKYYVLGYS